MVKLGVLLLFALENLSIQDNICLQSSSPGSKALQNCCYQFPVLVYLNSRVAAAQSQGPVMALRVHDVYDILSGAQQNSGKHLGLRKIRAVTKAILRWRDCCK